MTTSSDDEVQTLQREVQRLLGRSLIRLQQYERLMKAVIAHHEITAPFHALETDQAARVASTARKTLGILIGELLGSFLVRDRGGKPAEDAISSLGGVASISLKMTLRLSDADFARTENALKEMLLLRNNLVHHFIDQHELWSVDGCRGAQKALLAAHRRIDEHVEQLRSWAEGLQHARRLTAELYLSEGFDDWAIHGTSPEMNGPAAGIERALRNAAGALAVDGWAPVTGAAKWIAERHPEELPLNYGCSSWRQILHESRCFELRYFELDGQRSAWFREK